MTVSAYFVPILFSVKARKMDITNQNWLILKFNKTDMTILHLSLSKPLNIQVKWKFVKLEQKKSSV